MIGYGILAFSGENFGQSHKKLARSWSTTTAHNLWLTAISNAKNLETGVRTTIPKKNHLFEFQKTFWMIGWSFFYIFFTFRFCWHLLYAYSSYHPFRLQCGILFFCLTMNNKLESDKKKGETPSFMLPNISNSYYSNS